MRIYSDIMLHHSNELPASLPWNSKRPIDILRNPTVWTGRTGPASDRCMNSSSSSELFVAQKDGYNTVLVHSGCYDEIPDWVAYKQQEFLPVLEGLPTRSSCPISYSAQTLHQIVI